MSRRKPFFKIVPKDPKFLKSSRVRSWANDVAKKIMDDGVDEMRQKIDAEINRLKNFIIYDDPEVRR